MAQPAPGRGVQRAGEPVSRTERLLFVGTLLAIGYLVLPPFIYMVYTSLMPGGRYGIGGSFAFSAYTDVLTARGFPRLVANTAIFAAGSTALGVGLGGVMAWLVERTNTPLKSMGYVATFIGFAVPGILRTIGWILLLGANGVANRVLAQLLGPDSFRFNVVSAGGMIFVEGLMWAPTAFMLLLAPFRAMDPALEEAAAVSGATPFRTIRSVTARLLLPSLLSVTLLMAIRAIQALEVPLIVGMPAGISVLTTQIYEQIQRAVRPDYARASAYGVLLVILLSAVLWLYYRVTRDASRFQTVTGKGYRPRVMDLRGWRWLGASLLVLVAIIQALPVGYLVYASFLPTLASRGPLLQHLTLANYVKLIHFPNIARASTNSLVVALVSATVAVLLAGVASWLVVRSRLRLRWGLELLLGVPLVLPGIVMSLAVLVVYLRVPVPIYGSIWILVIAYLATYTPFAIRYIQPALLQIGRELEESAYTSGAGTFVMFRRILMPLLMPALSGAWIFVFFITVRELSVSSLLYTARSEVIATQILDLWTNGSLTQLSAFGTVVALGSVLVAAVVYRISGKFGIQG